MSWKNLLVCGGLVCLLAAPAVAQPTVDVTSSYDSALDVIMWEVSITPTSGYSDAVAIEAALELNGFTTNAITYDPALQGNSSTSETTHSAGDNNGTAGQTWYYNVDMDGTTLLWNTQEDMSDIEQNPGANPYAGGETEGLWLETAMNRLFASLGSDVGMPQPIKTLHIASHDGILSWADLLVAEELVPPTVTETLLSGQATSVNRIDMNGDGMISGLDIDPLKSALGGLFPRYAPAGDLFGLDGRARADANNDGMISGLDIDPAKTCLGGGACPTVIPGAGAGAGAGAVVPEPASAALLVLGMAGLAAVRRRRR